MQSVRCPRLTGSSELCSADSLEDLMVFESRARPQTTDTHRTLRSIHILQSISGSVRRKRLHSFFSSSELFTRKSYRAAFLSVIRANLQSLLPAYPNEARLLLPAAFRCACFYTPPLPSDLPSVSCRVLRSF